MRTIRLEVSDFQSLTDLDNYDKNKSLDSAGIYVFAPFNVPYYVGETEKGLCFRIKKHLSDFTNPNQCKYVIFNLSFYFSTSYERNQILPRAARPTNPKIFKPNPNDVLFWREKVGFMSPNDLINPLDWTLPLSNLKHPLKQDVLDVIHEVFSLRYFRFFFVKVEDEEFKNNKKFLRILESTVKFSLKINTAGESKENINNVFLNLSKLGISQIDLVTPNAGIKNLFYSSPHDGNHYLVTNLKGIVNII